MRCGIRGFARRALRCSLATAGAAALATAVVAATPPPVAAVEIAHFAFAPREITVAPGTRVRWTNRDETPHTVTSQGASKTLASPGLDLDDRFEFVFAEEGDYPYLCTVHPMMTGVVHVRRGAAPAR